MSQQSFSMRDVVNISNYRWLWFGQSVSQLGDALMLLAMLLFVNQLSDGSTSAIAWLMVVIAIPTITIGLIAGTLVDRWNQRRTMLVCDLIRFILISLLAMLCLLDALPLKLVYLFAFIEAIVGSFFTPARRAFLPSIVPKEGLLAANSLGQSSVVLCNVLGTAAAGVLVGILGLFWLVFAINALTFLLSATFIGRIEKNDTHKPESTPSANTAQMIRATIRQTGDGLKLLGQNRVLLGFVIGMAVAMLGFGAVDVLEVPFVVNDLQASETWFGAITFFESGAMIISGLFVTTICARFNHRRLFVFCLFIAGSVTFATASVVSVWHLFPIIFIRGLVNTPAVTTYSTFLQTSVERSYIGRVSAAASAIIQFSALLSMCIAGFLAEWLGAQTMFIMSGSVVCLAAVCATLIFSSASSKKELDLTAV